MRITNYKLQITKAVLMVAVMAAAALLSGCGSIRGKGGVSKVSVPGVTAVAQQPENPKDGTTQDVNSETEESYTVPAGSTIVEAPNTKLQAPEKSQAPSTNVATVVRTITVAEPMLVTKHTKHSAATVVGAAQVDVAGKILAVAKSVRWIQVVGILFIAFGIASLAWPPLKLIINSVTTSALCIAAGAFLLFVTPVIALHPAICFAIAGGVVGLWYFAHRHGGLQGELQALKNLWASARGEATSVAATSVPATRTPDAGQPTTKV